ncbi:MAG: hypothetical protein L6R39_006127 [Caloplaca ligustica]|nr:MAG: hypothetical protein L6R39_006127 [Caloplaca ligustica]
MAYTQVEIDAAFALANFSQLQCHSNHPESASPPTVSQSDRSVPALADANVNSHAFDNERISRTYAAIALLNLSQSQYHPSRPASTSDDTGFESESSGVAPRETRKVTVQPHAFNDEWASRTHPADWSNEKLEEEFFIEARRKGMTPAQLRDSPHLPSFREKALHQVVSRINKLKRRGVDITPQTDEHHKRSAARKTGSQTQEMNDIAAACRRGMTPKEILEAGIVKHGKKDEEGLKLRIYRMKRRGLDVGPC